MEANKLTYKQKDKLIKYVYHVYYKALLELENFEYHDNFYPESSIMVVKENMGGSCIDKYWNRRIERKRELEMYIKMVDDIHKHISKQSLMVLENEYINVLGNDWWKNYFSRSSYYRIKNKAFDEFFMYFDDSLFMK